MLTRLRLTFILGVVVIATALLGSGSALSATSPAVSYGWDNGLHLPCAKETSPGAANYFQTSFPFCAGQQSWTIDVESELAGQYGRSCPGPMNQSFPINTAGSPLKLQTLSNGDGSYTINLKTDLYGTRHPCGAGYYTFFAWMDHANHNGGPLARPDALDFSFNANYNDYTPNGQARFIAGFQGWWNGTSHIVEINLASTKWDDMDPDPLVVLNDKKAGFLLLDGRALGLTVTKAKNATVDIDWGSTLNYLIKRGLLPAPVGGWSDTNSATQAVYLATEARNKTASGAVVTDLYFNNWRTARKLAP